MDGGERILVTMQGQPEGERVDLLLEVVEYVTLAIELLAVSVIAVTMVYAFAIYFWNRNAKSDGGHYQSFRARLGSGLLLGLEILVAADVIRTVAFEPTLQSVAILGLLVVIRTFLSWALVVEIEERWPWQGRKPE
ncbi:MAG: DUF1622 domain-containing protein [Chloroflexota bacterium]|nr:DUF1622 domain-containing protein [Chloroflexota bacterium]